MGILSNQCIFSVTNVSPFDPQNSDLVGSLLIKNLELIINNCGIFFENDFNKSQSDTF